MAGSARIFSIFSGRWRAGMCSAAAICAALTGQAPAGAIAHGHTAAPGEVPVIVQVTGGLSPCSGTIIDPSTVVTAAHCLTAADRSRLAIRYGSTVNGAGTLVPVTSVRTHPLFDPIVGNNDIAILKLATPIVYGPGAAPASLPPQGHDPAAGTTGTIAGWGGIVYGEISAAALRAGSATVVPRAECTVPGTVRVTLGDIVCVSGAAGATRPCAGDSGGPLLLTAPGAPRPALAGITSQGLPCGLGLTTNAVFTRTGNFTNWILANSHP